MSQLIKPKDIFVEFLRAVYKEPGRSGLSKRHTNTSAETTTPASGTTSVTVSNTKLLCVNSVLKGITTATKYSDYDIDLTNNRIIFSTALSGESVTIDYDYNTNGYSWINPSNPERDTASALTRTDYPRISVIQLDYSGNILGFNQDNQDNRVVFQIDVVTKDKLKATSYSRIRTGNTSETITENLMNTNLVDTISNNLLNAIKRGWRGHIKAKMYPSANYLKGVTDITIDQESGLFRKAIDVEMKGFDMGEYS